MSYLLSSNDINLHSLEQINEFEINDRKLVLIRKMK